MVTVPSGSSGQLSTRIERQDPLMAPIAKGQQIGTLHVQLGHGDAGRSCPFLPWKKCQKVASFAASGMPFACGFGDWLWILNSQALAPNFLDCYIYGLFGIFRRVSRLRFLKRFMFSR